jgi:hypothetical protein
MIRTTRSLCAVAVVAGGFVAAGPAEAARPGWVVYPAQSVAAQNFVLDSVAVPTAGDIWAVGYRYDYVGSTQESRTLVEHSAGGTFVMVPSPDREPAPATNLLGDVSGVSSSDVWAVGYSSPTPGGVNRTLVEHWNGSTWTISPSQDPGSDGNVLGGVLALSANDVWAVGARQDGLYEVPMAEHWNGSAWSVAAMPNPSYCTFNSYLTDITEVKPTDLWAVGWCQTSTGGEQGYVMRWNGSRWRYASVVTDGIPHNTELYGVSAAGPSSVWLVGYSDGALTLRWDNKTVQRVSDGPLQANESLSAVVAPHGKAAFAVGAGGNSQPPFAGPAVVRRGGGTGTQETVPVKFGQLNGVTYDPSSGRVWAVGSNFGGQYDKPLVVSRSV